MVTHYQRLLDYIEPDFVTCCGRSHPAHGDKSLALDSKARYDWVRQEPRRMNAPRSPLP